MERIDRLIIKAQDKTRPKITAWEKAMQNNPYAGQNRDTLLALLSVSREDWRQIVQACVWKGAREWEKRSGLEQKQPQRSAARSPE